MEANRNEPDVKSGDLCKQPDCGGKLLVYSTRISNDVRVRYLRCSKCQTAPENNKQIVPLAYAPSRAN